MQQEALSEWPESELLRRYVEEGDAQAFGTLVKAHQGMVFSVCQRVLGNGADAEDAMQNSFLRFAREAATLHAPVAGWLHCVAARSALDLRRKNTVRVSYESEAARQHADATDPSWDDLKQVVDEAISDLPTRLRTPFVLHYLEECTQAEVAAQMGLSQAAVSKQLQQALDALRKRLRREGVIATTTILAALFAAHGAEAVPAMLPATIGKMAAVGLATGSKAAGTHVLTIGGVSVAKAGIVAAIVVSALVACGILVGRSRSPNSPPGPTVAPVATANGGGILPAASLPVPAGQPMPAAPTAPAVGDPTPAASPAPAAAAPTVADLDQVEGIGVLAGDAASRELLRDNGFVVTPIYYRQIFSPYINSPVPPFITTDSLHRTFHVIFEEQIKKVETAFAGDVAALSNDMAGALAAYRATPGIALADAEASVLAGAYFAVGGQLLGQQVTSQLPDRVTAEIRLIQEAAGVAPSPLFGYEMDYSQFKPRGFYTETPVLQQYFRAMSWYGLVAFRLVSDRETRAAMIISRVYNEQKTVRDRWQRMDRVYTYLIAQADDLTPEEYAQLERTIVTKEAKDPLASFNQEAGKLRDPKINSMVIPPDAMPRWKELSKGLRFFGKRYLPDGEVFMALTYPAVPQRGFPTGLDMMAANGSPRAEELIRAEGAFKAAKYAEGFAQSRKALTDLKATPDASHYVGFLRLIETLHQPPAAQAPPFMKTPAYQDKNLMTSLAAWASMRHAWQLQAKQSVTYKSAEEPPEPMGFVEPNIPFFQRLDDLVVATSAALKDVPGVDLKRLESFRNLATQLVAIAEKELAAELLTPAEGQLLRRYGADIANMSYFEGNSYLTDGRLPWMSLVADVHTEHASAKTLGVATGGAKPMYVVVPYNDKLYLMVGGVYSYHEFLQPIADRLTDDEWRRLWDRGEVPPPPPWTSSFARSADVEALLAKLQEGQVSPQLQYASDPRIEETLKKELQPGGRFATGKTREAAITLYAAKAGRKGMPFLLEILKAPQQRDSYAVIAGMSSLAEAQDIPLFKTLALTGNATERGAAVSILANIDAPDTQDALVEVLRQAGRNDSVAQIALREIGERGARDISDALMDLHPKLAQQNRDSLIRALAQLWGTGPYRTEMQTRLPSNLTPDQEAALRKRVGDFMLNALPASRGTERSAILQAISAMNLTEAVPVLEQLDTGTANESGQLLDTLNRTPGEASSAAMLRMLQKEKDAPYLASQIAQYLGNRNYAPAVPALEKLIEDTRPTPRGDKRVCDAAMQALAKLEPDGPGYWKPERDPQAFTEQLRVCWKTWLAVKAAGGPGMASPELAVTYANELLALLVTREKAGYGLYDPYGTLNWARKANGCLPTMTAADRAVLAPKIETLLIAETRKEIAWIADIIEKYYHRDLGTYPPVTPGAWEKAVEEKRYVSLDTSRRDAQGALLDAWGNSYRYLSPGKHSKAPFEIYSFGPNGKDDDGGGDDIASWSVPVGKVE
jgi:RNA polymerase sigma factor (sigma-70 family)